MKIRDLYIKWQVWRGKALDIHSFNKYPSHVLRIMRINLRSLFALLLIGVTQQIMAQQLISTNDFEINLPEGWECKYTEELGNTEHRFEKDSTVYTINVFAIPLYPDDAFEIFLPEGTKYMKMVDVQIGQIVNGTEFKCKWLQNDKSDSNIIGCVYTAVRNDKTIVIQEMNRSDSLSASENLLNLFQWPEVIPLPLTERVERFCQTMNGLLEESSRKSELVFKHSAENKKFIIEYHLQNPEDEIKGNKKSKDERIQELFYGFVPLFLEMGKDEYSFQLTEYLMNGEKEKEIIYQPEDYRHLLEGK